MGGLEVIDEDPEPVDSPQYDFGIYEPEDDGDPIEFNALTSIDSLDIVSTAGSGGGGSFKAAAPEFVSQEANWVAWKEVTVDCGQSPCAEHGPWNYEAPYETDQTVSYNGKVWVAISNNYGAEPTDTSEFWVEASDVPSDCLVFKPFQAKKKKHKFTGSTVGYSAGTSTITGTGQAKKITITPKTYKLDQKSIIFTQQRKLLKTTNSKVVLSNALQKLNFTTKPFTLTGSNTQIIQQMEKLKLTSEKLRLESIKETGDLVEYTVSIFSGKQKLMSTPCGALSVSLGVSINTSIYTDTFTIKGFEPDGSTQTVTKDLFSPTVELTAVGGPTTSNIGGTAVTTGPNQEQEVDINVSSISVEDPVIGPSITVPNLTLKNGDPCKDPEEWDPTKPYNVDDWVIRNGKYYQAVAYNFDKDPSLFFQGKGTEVWAPNQAYALNQLVTIDENGVTNIYLCVNAHTSSATFGLDFENWVIQTTSDEALPWAEKSREVYCQDTDNQEELIPRIENAEIVVEDAPGTAFSGAGPSSSVLTAPEDLDPIWIEHVEPTGTPVNYDPYEDKNVYLPFLDSCPTSGVSIATLSGDHPISLAMTSRTEMVTDDNGDTSCSLIIENEIKYRKKEFDIKCGVLTNEQCEEEVTVTNEAVIDAFTTRKHKEVTLSKVYKTAGIQVCAGSTTKTLDLAHFNQTGSDPCVGWVIPCEAFGSSGSDPAPTLLVPAADGTISLLSLDCDP